MLSKIRKLNYPLIFGVLIIVLLIIISMYGDQIVKLDPYKINLRTRMFRNGELIYVTPLSPPNKINIFGTDILGRDIFSRIISGAKTTLSLALFITIARFIIAVPFAFLAAFGKKSISPIINFFNYAFSAIPILIMSIIILNLEIIKNLELHESMIAFTIVLTFLGWGRLGKSLESRILNILELDFIKGEIAIGKSKFMIAIQNVLPHLLVTIIIYMFIEMGRVLFLIAQLGVFEVYVGKNKLDAKMLFTPQSEEGLGLDFWPSYAPEWGAMLGASRYALLTRMNWMVLPTAAAFYISITGFNLVGEGLKIEIDKRKSMTFAYVKRIPHYLSPKTYIHEIKYYRENKKAVNIKTGILIIILVVVLVPPPPSLINVDSHKIYSHIEELSKDKYEGRRLGTKGRDEACNYITEKLKEYDTYPFFDNRYIDETQKAMNNKNIGATIKGDNSNGNVSKLIIATNYDYVGYYYNKSNKGLLYNASSVGAMLEIIEQLKKIKEKPNIDIVFLFFDGSQYNGMTGAELYFSKNRKELADTFAITFNNLGFQGSNRMYLDYSNSSSASQVYFKYIKYFLNRGKQLGINVMRDKLAKAKDDISQLRNYKGNGILLESLNLTQKTKYAKREQSNIKLINKDNLKKQTQLILDAILYIAYDGKITEKSDVVEVDNEESEEENNEISFVTEDHWSNSDIQYEANPKIYPYKYLKSFENRYGNRFPDFDPERHLNPLELRSACLTDFNLEDKLDALLYSSFNTITQWPEKIPKEFDPEKVLEIGMNPGLNIRELHNKGVTGKGIGIAIIDYTLLPTHEDYKDNLTLYEHMNCDYYLASFHGPGVASVAVGKKTGIAPKADLYFIACENHDYESDEEGLIINAKYPAIAIKRILEINEALPEEKKIRVISMSHGYKPNHRGYDEFVDAVEEAKEHGVAVISCNLFEYDQRFHFWGLHRDPLSDPDNFSSYTPYNWNHWIALINHTNGDYYSDQFNKIEDKQIMLVPMESRTTASGAGEHEYKFSRVGGWSWGVPYISGLYALGCQVRPNLTIEEFWTYAYETGISREVERDGVKYEAKIFNPIKLIEKLEEMNK